MPAETIAPELLDSIRDTVRPLTGSPGDYDALLDQIGEARFVLLGEATHGTHELYRSRAQLTRRLIEEKGFTAVAVEADWPDAYRINRFVRGEGGDAEAVEALGSFERFPRWMWRNADVLDFVGWLRGFNEERPPEARVGFYGLDLYSLYTSADEVIRYLEGIAPEAAAEARRRYGCFQRFREDAREYGRAAASGLESCEEAVVSQLLALQQRAGEQLRGDGGAADPYFDAEQNARIARNAERYYRAMFQGDIQAWNLRDQHMVETLEQLTAHLEKHGPGGRIAVWAHNSHLGDARATEAGDHGELSVGQLLRERYGRECFLLGFTTWAGTVTAASWWGGDAERLRLRPALPGSYEDVLHRVGVPRFYLPLRELGEAAGAALAEPRLERAVGVIYRPWSERESHYLDARLPAQFDALLHFDLTRAVEPLERTARWTPETPETFPSGV